MALWKARGGSLNKYLEFRSWHCGRLWKSRDPSYLRDATRKPWGRQQGRKTQQHKPKKTFHSNTQSVSLKFQLLLQRTEGNNHWGLFPNLSLLWTKLGPFEPVLLEMKNVRLHMHLSLNVGWHSQKKTSQQLLLKRTVVFTKHIENLFVHVVCFRFVSSTKKLHAQINFRAKTKLLIASLKFQIHSSVLPASKRWHFHHPNVNNFPIFIEKPPKQQWSLESDDASRRSSSKKKTWIPNFCVCYSSLDSHENVAKLGCHQTIGDQIFSSAPS